MGYEAMLTNEVLEEYRAFARSVQRRLAELEKELETKKGLDAQISAASSPLIFNLPSQSQNTTERDETEI